jgi:hypothetical protein
MPSYIRWLEIGLTPTSLTLRLLIKTRVEFQKPWKELNQYQGAGKEKNQAQLLIQVPIKV